MHMDIIPMHISNIIMETVRFMSAFLLNCDFPCRDGGIIRPLYAVVNPFFAFLRFSQKAKRLSR